MQIKSPEFKQNARIALKDEQLQSSLAKFKTGFPENRRRVIAKLPEFDALRDQARDLKNHILANLDIYLEEFERKVTEQGGQVHWASTSEEACEIIHRICQSVDAKTVTKGKSMVSEEVGLNDYLEKRGIEPVETDLGEYILQLRHDSPSHIIAPAIHLTVPQVADTFHEHHKTPRTEVGSELMAEARQVLRKKFVSADVGITGANFLVAETGGTIIVTNEGNGDLTQTLPDTHIVISSIEKVVPTLEDMSLFLRVLARSATGQEFSAYTTLSSGGRRDDEKDGPKNFHVVLVDNGRSNMVGTDFQDMLRCIRCSSCMNHCPVYGAVGGHAYGWVYPGPMGSVLTPQMIGIDKGAHLPNASTACGKCEEVCPVRIPLPKLMRHWREKEFEKHLTPKTVRWGIGLWGMLARNPALYRFSWNLGNRMMRLLGKSTGRISKLPLASGWTDHRDMPAPTGQTFMQAYKAQKRGTRS